MISIITTLLGALVPVIPNLFKDFFKGKLDKADKAFELEMFKLQLQHAQANAMLENEKYRLQAEVQSNQAMSEFLIKQNQYNAARSKIKTGIKWVDCCETLIRSFFGVIAGLLLGYAAIQAYQLSVPIWECKSLWEIVQLIVGYFVGYSTSAFTQKKVYS